LGFGFKWNMGWMHDTLAYMNREGVHRAYHQNEITFSIMYAFSENYVLPLSHDEVVHGKGSLLARMPGDGWQQFANLRTLYTYMFTHPGKKLLFMGAEIAQGMEWSADRSLDWFLLEYAQHRGIRDLVVELNRLYRSLPALYELDNDPQGFEWIDISDEQASVISYVRRARNQDDFLVVICNFTAVVRDDYRIGVPQSGEYEVVLNSDDRRFDGSGAQVGELVATDEPAHWRSSSLTLRLPPLGVVILKPKQ
jgi:1,4-alpha-glucan branching enzyme